MKHAKPLSVLILIGSALLLSAASTPQPKAMATPQNVATLSRPTDSDTSATAARRTAEEERHDRREESLEENLVLLTAVLAAIEAVTLFVFAFTMFANIRAANAAKTAAEAARDSAKIAEQTMAVGQRGYLYLSGIRFTRIGPSTIWITYPIYNAGQTPATFTGGYMRASVYPIGKFPDPIKRGEVATLKQSVVVPPAQIDADFAGYKGHYTLELSDEEIIAIDRGASQFVFHGFIRYIDIFDQVHDTGFGVAFASPIAVGGTHQMAWIQRLGFNWFD